MENYMFKAILASLLVLGSVSANATVIVSRNADENLALVVEESSAGKIRIDVCTRSGEKCRQLGAKSEYTKQELQKRLRHYRLTGFYPSLAAYGGMIAVMGSAGLTGGLTAPFVILPAAVGILATENNSRFQSLDQVIDSLADKDGKLTVTGNVEGMARTLRAALPL
jgi:hypothetical protein